MTDQRHSVPRKMQGRYDEVVGVTDAFCRAHLNDEYRELCCKLAAKLSRKRPSPLESGQAKSWAGAIVHTVGRVNFLFDKGEEPYMTVQELCAEVGVSQSAVSRRSRQIMDMLGIVPMDPEYTLPSRMDGNLLTWLISVDGVIIDVRSAPRQVQEEAFRLGLIPHLPE